MNSQRKRPEVFMSTRYARRWWRHAVKIMTSIIAGVLATAGAALAQSEPGAPPRIDRGRDGQCSRPCRAHLRAC